MDCERFQVELEELLDGELPQRLAANLRAHLEVCAGCRRVERDLRREAQIFARYHAETEITPSPALWGVIRERIRAETRSPVPRSPWHDRLSAASFFGFLLRPAVLRQLAAAAALIAVTVMVTVFFLGRPDERREMAGVAPTPATASSPAPSPSPVPAAGGREIVREQEETVRPKRQATPKDLPKNLPKNLSDEELIRAQVARAEREYVSAIRLLDRAIAERKGQIDAGVYAQYESSLALIDESIAKSRRALREHPQDVAAGQFLLAAYARKVELMQEIALR